MKTITIRLGLGKAPIIEVNGVQGGGCAELSAPFERALGRVAGVEVKPEYYEQPVAATVDQTLGGGL